MSGSDRGWAGASAHREHTRLRREREAAIDDADPRIRDLLRDAARHSPHIAAWEKGAAGEAIVGRMLNDLSATNPGVRVLHDRAMPARSANIDHIAVAPTGVYVIDAKHYNGQPRYEARPDRDESRRLFVGRDDRTALVDAVRWQAAVIAAILGDPEVPVRGILCFVDAEWTIGNGFVVDGVGVTSPDRLAALLRSPGPLAAERAAGIHRHLADSLAPA